MLDLWQTTWGSTSKLYAYNTSMGNSIQCFRRQYTVFPPDVLRLKTWFKLSRVKLYRNDLWGNKNYFWLAGDSSLSRVRVTEGNITVNVWRKSRGNRFWFELTRGSSYRESTLPIPASACNGFRKTRWNTNLFFGVRKPLLMIINPFFKIFFGQALLKSEHASPTFSSFRSVLMPIASCNQRHLTVFMSQCVYNLLHRPGFF